MPPGKRRFWSDAKIIDGLEMGCGNVSEACRMMIQKYNHKCSRSTVYNAINANPAVREHWKQCEGILFDVSFKGVTARAQAGNPRDQRIIVSKLGVRHGMPAATAITRGEQSGPDGTPGAPKHQEVIADGEALLRKRIESLDDDEVAELLRAVKVINGTGNPGANLVQSAASGAGIAMGA